MAQRDLVHGIPAIKHTTQVCDVCLIGKHSRAPFPKKAKDRSTSPLDLVYRDLCGPITPPTPSGKKYIFLLVDDYSRYMWVYFLSTKDQAFDTFKEYKKSIENELRTTLKMLRTDRGGEFTSNEFTQYCKENGIARQLTAPYSPQQNGVVERRNRTIMSTTRCMMKATNMPQNFWAEAVRHTIYILNSVCTKALEDSTPYEAIKLRKPNLENLRVFGCISYAKVPSQHLTKLDDRSSRMVYLGNEQGSKAYRLFNPTTQWICVSRDVKFKESETWDWKEYMTTAATTQELWLKRLVSKLTHSQEEKVTIKVDNKSAIALMKNPVLHGRSKHIDTKYHFIRECVEREVIQVKFVSGEYQRADILTKALLKIKFQTMRQLIGLKDPRHRDCD
nr:zinc finger, CCHC-type [Tanacetum cinerariifolium]